VILTDPSIEAIRAAVAPEALAAATTPELVDLLFAIQAKTSEVVEELAERF
jgi:hypothetical protein